MNPTFIEILAAWKADNGGRIPVTSKERRAALRDLFSTLKHFGLNNEIKQLSNRNRIVIASVNTASKQVVRWKYAVEADLAVVMAEELAPKEA